MQIRPYIHTDIDSHFDAVCESIDELSPWFSWCNRNYSKKKSEEFIINRCQEGLKSGNEYNFAIIDYATNIYLGNCSLQRDKNMKNVAWMNYWVRTKETRRGIATIVAGHVGNFGFTKLALSEIQIRIAKCNKGSRKVTANIGAVLIEKNAKLEVRDKTYDAEVFTVTQKQLRVREGATLVCCIK